MNTRAKVYMAVWKYTQNHDGRSPSIEEIRKAVGLASTNTVLLHIKSLVKSGDLGQISTKKGSTRNLTVPGAVYQNPIPPRWVMEQLIDEVDDGRWQIS